MDDGIGIEYNYEEAKRKSEFVQETLTKSGFIPNIQKSTWEPCKILTWLGIDINLSSGTLKITKSCIDNVLNTICLILSKNYVSARILAKLTGQLISTKYVIGDIEQLKTWFLYKSIEQSSSWDKTFNIRNYNDTVDKILFGSSISWNITTKQLTVTTFRCSAFIQTQVKQELLAFSTYGERKIFVTENLLILKKH